MAEASIASAIVPLVSVMIGGALTLGDQWYFHKLKVEDERKAKRAAKFEEIVTALYATGIG